MSKNNWTSKNNVIHTKDISKTISKVRRSTTRVVPAPLEDFALEEVNLKSSDYKPVDNKKRILPKNDIKMT